MSLKFFIILFLSVGTTLNSANANYESAWKKFFQISPQTIGSYHSGVGEELYGKLSLTFDDGPNEYTPFVLSVLEAYNRALRQRGLKPIKATFFINGWRVAKYNYKELVTDQKFATELVSVDQSKLALVKEIVKRGHILGNHSVHHSRLKNTTLLSYPWAVQNEIRLTHEAVYDLMPSLIDCQNKWFFRAPFGAWMTQNAEMGNRDAVVGKYIGPIGWDIGGDFSYDDGVPTNAADWDDRCENNIVDCARGYLNRSYRESKGTLGGVVLFHDVKPVTYKLLDILLHVWTGINPYHPTYDTDKYRYIESLKVSFVKRYGYSHKPRFSFVGLDEMKLFEDPKHDKRYAWNGYCK